MSAFHMSELLFAQRFVLGFLLTETHARRGSGSLFSPRWFARTFLHLGEILAGRAASVFGMQNDPALAARAAKAEQDLKEIEHTVRYQHMRAILWRRSPRHRPYSRLKKGHKPKMASEFELLGTEKAGAVIGTTTHSEMDVSLYGKLKRTEYMTFAAGSTSIRNDRVDCRLRHSMRRL